MAPSKTPTVVTIPFNFTQIPDGWITYVYCSPATIPASVESVLQFWSSTDMTGGKIVITGCGVNVTVYLPTIHGTKVSQPVTPTSKGSLKLEVSAYTIYNPSRTKSAVGPFSTVGYVTVE